jgi:hypothetical protein
MSCADVGRAASKLSAKRFGQPLILLSLSADP